MSQENVEVVRRALTALDRRDVEAYLEVVSPQIELITFASPLQGQGPITGHEGIRDYFHELWSYSEWAHPHSVAWPSAWPTHETTALAVSPPGALQSRCNRVPAGAVPSGSPAVENGSRKRNSRRRGALRIRWPHAEPEAPPGAA
jgi:hypothetical protein